MAVQVQEINASVQEAHQSTVDGDALFGPLAGGSGPLQPLGAGEVHKVKFGRQRLVLVQLRVAVGDSVVGLVLVLDDGDMEHK